MIAGSSRPPPLQSGGSAFGSETFRLTYGRTWLYSTIATVVASCIAFPACYGIAFKLGRNMQRFAIFPLVIPFFTSYLVRVYSWQVFLTDAGIINVLLAHVGIGPLPLINTFFGTLVGYLALTLPLVILLQLFSLMSVDRSLVEAAHCVFPILVTASPTISPGSVASRSGSRPK
ncbi:MAG TPA: hypothetical protein VLB05_00700 [Dongiaceae bacterium]|nr:hypothetical protein [Dongiaceae bacterium]